MVLQPGIEVALVVDVAIAVVVAILVEPFERGPRLHLEVLDELTIAGPALDLIEQDDEEGRHIGRAVVGTVRPLLEGSQFAVAQLVQDLAGLLIAEIIQARPLPGGQRAQRGDGELGHEG